MSTSKDNLGVFAEEDLSVHQEILDAMGWSRFSALVDVRPELLSQVLLDLRGDDCVHSWHTPLSRWDGTGEETLVQTVIKAAQVQRPTTIFTYVGVRLDGTYDVVGAAAVSDRIHHDFPHDGFPVIARAFIRPPYRSNGLYPYLVRHRLDYCQRQQGEAFRAVHLGSADPAVWRTVGGSNQISLPFVYVGEEDLDVRGSRHEVRDFLAFSSRYTERLLQSVVWTGEGEAPPVVLEVGRMLKALVTEGADSARYPALRDLLARAAVEEGWVPAQESIDLQALLDFCDAIPIVR